DAELRPLAREAERAPRRGVERHVPHGRAQAVLREVEVLERPAHEDPRGVDRTVEGRLAVREENLQAPARQQSRALQAREARSDYDDVVGFHRLWSIESLPTAFCRQAFRPSLPRLVDISHLVSYAAFANLPRGSDMLGVQ